MKGPASRGDVQVPARMVPAVMLQRGRVVTPGPSGPEVLRDAEGRPTDVLDLADRLIADHGRLYVIDLDGIDRDSPQLDYLQEMSRDGELWVDAGVRTADQAIDILVAGASRAVLSSSALRAPEEVGRAWALSQEIVVELDASVGAPGDLLAGWGLAPDVAAQRVRSMGPTEIVFRFPSGTPLWDAFARVASGGPTWAAGPIGPSDAHRVASAHGAGGIFLYGTGPTEADSPPTMLPPRARDDEN